MSFFKNFSLDKIKNGLSKTRNKIVQSISETLTGKAQIDDNTLDQIEEILITSDIGAETAEMIIDNLRKALKSEKDRSVENVLRLIKIELSKILIDSNNKSQSFIKPYIIVVVGVNGVGKTTSIGKLAYNYKNLGYKVIVGAADTFRAAANEQLEIWAKLAGVEIINSNKGADPSSVVFETIKRAVDENYDIVLIDTAGRLHNKTNLMNELSKIKKVIKKFSDSAPHETLLVVDGTTGQNALIQAIEFSKVIELTGLIITKLDGTAKGGMVFQISKKLKIPIKYIGVGEGIEDLQEFDKETFISALFELK
ncbi:Signal recognition particle GTPase protein [Ignavibacterium album JCM 16511]|uniref:Signal recognition particle receptor FtsY n=1 Tax=Ignavibacterium album (strain DSM 19864 / JCM 16511 / NBRC 101810 / Mat9-16) TaxID=945713 RepID=I0AJX7_IGNAJ|nr:signal recognition particle-docking protein FtsY [Ignavibacterium album]AFH49284.1 Signal recognition particle GTPase protein [Ignavibacterium album JCM 16511]